MSLTKKAKTLNELLWENRLEWDKSLRMGVTEQKQIMLAPKYQEKWVRLEDVEQEIKKVKELGAEAASVMVEGELKDLKQKLRLLKHQLLDFLDTLYYPHKIPDGLQNFIQEKFEELLKR